MSALMSGPTVSFAPQRNMLAVRDLLLNLVRTELTARYKNATFGLLWFILNPALMTGVLMVVFKGFIRIPIADYHLFLLAGVLPWTYFQMGLGNAATSLTRAPAMIKRVRVPRVLVPLATILASLVHFLFALAVVLAVLLALGRAPGPGPLLTLPLIIAIETLCLVGLGLVAASLNVRYRDVEHVVTMGLRFGFWLTPIFYPLEYVPARFRGIASLNPLTGLLESYRAVLVENTLPGAGALGSAAMVAVVLIGVGVAVFTRLDPHLDDHV
jgi:ABC-type polysaccharide/polyol phosphate export permease